MIDIFKIKIIRIEEKEFNINEKNFQLISIEAIIIVDNEAEEANKNNQSQKYLFSLILSFLRNKE